MKLSATIRTMTANDLPRALELTQAENWPHRAEDWAFHFKLGHGWVAEIENRVVGTTLLWPFGDSDEIASVGLIVVDQSNQGQGIGRQLLQHAIASSPKTELRLVATEAGLKLYQQNGFDKTGKIRQCQGIPSQVPEIELPEGMECRQLTAADLDALVRLDTQAFGHCRHSLLESLMTKTKGVALTRKGVIESFAMIREGGRGMQFGPVVATNDTQAKYLIATLLQNVDQFTRIDITDQAAELHPWFNSIGLHQVDVVTAMTRLPTTSEQNGQSTTPEIHTYGLVSQAFG